MTDGVTGAVCDADDVADIAAALERAAALTPGELARAAAEPYAVSSETELALGGAGRVRGCAAVIRPRAGRVARATAGGEQRVDLRGLHGGMRVEVALPVRAAELDQAVVLTGDLDALGDRDAGRASSRGR